MRDNGDGVEKTCRCVLRAHLGEVYKYRAAPLLYLILMDI